MKKYIILLAAAILCLGLLAGCGCEHQWQDAACETPKTCTACGEIEGEALGHTWADATCEAPKTCSACARTEGEALGHTWVDATCDAPQTCSVCDATEGEKLEHVFGDWTEIDTETEEHTCTACGYAEQQTIDRQDKLLSLLEGNWGTYGYSIDEYIYSLDAFADPDELDYSMVLDASGSGTFTMTDDTEYNITPNFSIFEYTPESEEDVEAYSFALTLDLDSTYAFLFISEGTPNELWMYLYDSTWIIFTQEAAE